MDAVIAPPFFAVPAATLGWRYAFMVSGLLGFLCLALWLFIYHLPPMLFGGTHSLTESGKPI